MNQHVVLTMGGIIEDLQQEGEGAAGGEAAVGAALSPQRPPHHGGEGGATNHSGVTPPLPLPGVPRNPGGVLCHTPKNPRRAASTTPVQFSR